MSHFIAVSFAIALSIASLALPVRADVVNERVEQELRAYNDRYNALVASYDLQAFVALYGDAPLWIAPTVAPVRGLDVPRNTFQFIIDNKGQLTHTFDEFHVSDDGSQAVMMGQYAVNIEAAGAQSTGTYLFVLERVEDSWKIVVDMFNEHTNP